MTHRFTRRTINVSFNVTSMTRTNHISRYVKHHVNQHKLTSDFITGSHSTIHKSTCAALVNKRSTTSVTPVLLGRITSYSVVQSENCLWNILENWTKQMELLSADGIGRFFASGKNFYLFSTHRYFCAE